MIAEKRKEKSNGDGTNRELFLEVTADFRGINIPVFASLNFSANAINLHKGDTLLRSVMAYRGLFLEIMAE